MKTVNVRELRNHGGEVLERVSRGEPVLVTRDGAPIAELTSVRRKSVGAADLIARRRTLPTVDPERLRADVDAVIDPSI